MNTKNKKLIEQFGPMIQDALKEDFTNHMREFSIQAREIMLREGFHETMFFFFGNRDNDFKKLDILQKDHNQKMSYFYFLGEEYGGEKFETYGFPMHLYFFVEGYVKSIPKDDYESGKFKRPAEDKENSYDVLMMQGMIPTAKFVGIKNWVYIRDENKKIIDVKDLLELEREKLPKEKQPKKPLPLYVEGESALLMAFMAGYMNKMREREQQSSK